MEGTRRETPRRRARLGSCCGLDFGHRACSFYFLHDRRRIVDAAVAPALAWSEWPLDYSRFVLVVGLGGLFRRRLLGRWFLRWRRLVRRRRRLGELVSSAPCWFRQPTRSASHRPFAPRR